LRTLLADEEYGPKLARLRGADERRVLDLVEQGRGRDARAAIDAADQRRLERLREARHATLYRRAVDNVTAQHQPWGATRGAVERHLGDATDAELRFAAGASRDQLVARARQPPRSLDRRDINPFWYH
jgi:hypothetical protein